MICKTPCAKKRVNSSRSHGRVLTCSEGSHSDLPKRQVTTIDRVRSRSAVLAPGSSEPLSGCVRRVECPPRPSSARVRCAHPSVVALSAGDQLFERRSGGTVRGRVGHQGALGAWRERGAPYCGVSRQRSDGRERRRGGRRTLHPVHVSRIRAPADATPAHLGRMAGEGRPETPPGVRRAGRGGHPW